MKVVQNLVAEYKKSPVDFFLLLLFSLIVLGFAIPDAHSFISIGVIGLFVLGVHQCITHKSLKRNWVILLPSVYFFVFVLSGINSENTLSWLNYVKLKLPFLALPFAFYAVKNISRKMLDRLLAIFVLVMSVSSAFVLLWYVLHFQEVNQLLLQGSPVPTPHSHVHYSAMLTIAFFCAVWLQNQNKYWLFIALHILFTLHILSVRGALVALYCGLLFMAVRFIFNEKRKLGIALLTSIIVLFYLGYNYIPSMHSRLTFMRYDFAQWNEGNIEGNSDAMRATTVTSGWKLLGKNFWFGVGVGDMYEETEKELFRNFPSIDNDRMPHKMPHNQFLWTACATGFWGLLAFLLSWLFPIWYFRNETDWLFIVLQIMLFMPCLVQYELETQAGGTLYALFQSIFYSYYSGKKLQH